MRHREALKQILTQTRPHWDRNSTRPSVRSAFSRAIKCRTPALGAEVYGSPVEEKVVYHSCKSRACTSCGHRQTKQWQRERWAALPDVPYKGITFTMPDMLWTLFCDNPALTRALPALAANLVQTWVRTKHGLRIGVIAIPHTFNGQLEFNAHVHTMVPAGGLQRAGSWIPSVYHDCELLTNYWRKGVIRLLRIALRSGLLCTKLNANELEKILAVQEARWWSVKIQSFRSKWHFLEYAGRYVRRPPIAQYRIIRFSHGKVRFWAKDKRRRCRVDLECSPEEFIDRWSQHIPERYQHAIRSFGLFSPRALRQTSAAIFATLGQTHRPRPKAVGWADAIKRHFHRDPLLDREGNTMKWKKRVPPVVSD
jgi:hypothetical protein